MPPLRWTILAHFRIYACALALAAVGCGELPSSTDEAESPPARAPLASQLTCSGQFLQFTVRHDCGTVIQVYNSISSTINDEIDNAILRWNNKIIASNISGLPSFGVTTNSGNAAITIVGASSGSPFCGNVTGNTLTLVSGSGCNTYTNKGSLTDVLTHELAHAYGWTGSTAHRAGVSGASDHCAVTLPADGSLNPQVCAHEIEGAAAAYGLRTFDDQAFWTKEFAVSSSALSSVSITQGATYQYAAPLWQLDRGGTASGSFTWQSANPSIATVSGGLVTGVSPGTAMLYLQGGTSSTYLTTNRFETNAGSVTVTITAPPLAALYVDDITMNGAIPITAPDSFTWTAVPPTGNTSGISYNWIIEYSDTSPPDSIFAPATANTWRGYARSGSYNIRIKVWPVRNDSIGSPAIRDFPVCTGTTEYLRAVPEDENNAVGGC